MEQRTEIRYRLTASVVFRWRGPGLHLLQGEGVCRDVSVTGIFVLTPTCPPTGTVVNMEIFFPSLRIGAQTLKLVTEGRVVRLEHPAWGEQGNGFAALLSDGFAIPRFEEAVPVSAAETRN